MIFFGCKDFQNAKGLLKHKNKIFVGYKNQDNGCYIATFSVNNLSLLGIFPIPHTKDIHSLTVINNNLFAISSGTNEVHVYNLSLFEEEAGILSPNRKIRPFKDISNKQDELHMNSILFFNNKILVSVFGKKSSQEDKWLKQDNGYVYDLVNDLKITEHNIKHPHSLFAHNNNIYFCESSSGSVVKNNKKVITDIEGYPRGLWVGNIDDKKIYF